jgi:hypothetical protein
MDMEVRKLPLEHKSHGWLLTQIKRGNNAVIYKGDMGDDITSYEVWHIRERKGATIKVTGKAPVEVPYREITPTNEDYALWAHQFIGYHYDRGMEEALEKAEIMFNKYETGERPLLIDHLHNRDIDDNGGFKTVNY